MKRTTEDGRVLNIPKSWKQGSVDILVGLDEDGSPVADTGDGFLFTLTMCCGASYKGCDGYVGCRACYQPVEGYGGGLPWGKVSKFVPLDRFIPRV